MTKPSVIRAALDSATPGPWEYSIDGYIVAKQCGCSHIGRMKAVDRPDPMANVKLVASAPGWLRELLDRQERMAALLREIECVGASEWCPCCMNLLSNGHAPDCELAAVLREVGE